MAEDKQALLKELTEARDAVQRQLDLMKTIVAPYGIRYRELQIGPVRDELTQQLRELNECIANLLAPDESG